MSAPFERKEGPPFEGGAHSSIDALSSKYGKYGKTLIQDYLSFICVFTENGSREPA